jgi:hypothetical protein
MTDPFKGVSLRFTWHYMPKSGKWGRMEVTVGGSDYKTGPGIACFYWQPMHGLMFSYLDLTDVPTGILDNEGQYILARAIMDARHNHWTRIFPNGLQMWAAMQRRIHKYMTEWHVNYNTETER